MATYATDTSVPADKSRAEIERTLIRYGATEFGYATSGDRALVLFTMQGKRIRFALDLPKPDDYRMTSQHRRRSDSAQREAHAQATRQRWRALALVVKAKLEAVETGIVTFEEEFAMHVLLPDGRQAGEHIVPFIEESYRVGSVPSLLAIGGGS